MPTLRVKIESLENTLGDTAKAWKAAESSVLKLQDALAFSSWDTVHRVLAPKRLDMVRLMTGQGPLGIREVARCVQRDFKGVHFDVDLLLRNGVIDKSGCDIVFRYDRIHVEFDIEAAA